MKLIELSNGERSVFAELGSAGHTNVLALGYEPVAPGEPAKEAKPEGAKLTPAERMAAGKAAKKAEREAEAAKAAAEANQGGGE